MKTPNYFTMGFKDMLPVISGVLPFGAVVGSIYSEAQMSSLQSAGMNIFVYAGASQLAAIEIMNKNGSAFVVILTALIINLRFLLYSAAISPVVMRSSLLVKIVSAHVLTDQSYAVMSAKEPKLPGHTEAIKFYFGTAACMWIFWHLSVTAGFVFGNFAPPSWSLDFGVPLSFIALIVPTIKSKNYLYVAIFSSVVSILLYSLPMKSGLVVTSALSIALAAFLSRQKESA